jgi:saccharopine dehydrogenase (NAD+, L-lysine-forming)
MITAAHSANTSPVQGQTKMKFLLRDEARETERRAPIIPDHAAELIQNGIKLDVERSTKRIFSDGEYERAGCRMLPAGSWLDASADTLIVGLKELPPMPENLTSPMVHFAHVYKEQKGWQEELQRFGRGGGMLYDIEYLTKKNGRRVAAFGYWAGWMGAALALWQYLANSVEEQGPKTGLKSFDSRDEIITQIKTLAKKTEARPKAVVIGALGRSGSGAVDALNIAKCEITKWDMAETANLNRPELLSHEILVNCVLMTGPGLRLASTSELASADCHLRMISDVSCDPFSSFNPLPVYDAPTSWDSPFIDLGNNGFGKTIELTAIDNLPSLIPREASEDFSGQFAPCLQRFDHGDEWQAAKSMFQRKILEA